MPITGDVSDGESREKLHLFMYNYCQKIKSSSPKTYARYFVRNKGFSKLTLLKIQASLTTHICSFKQKNQLERKIDMDKNKVPLQSPFLQSILYFFCLVSNTETSLIFEIHFTYQNISLEHFYVFLLFLINIRTI